MHKTTHERGPATVQPGERFLRLDDVNKKIGAKGKTVYGWIKEGRFPPSIPLTGRSVVWLNSEIEAWMASRVALRSPNQPNHPHHATAQDRA